LWLIRATEREYCINLVLNQEELGAGSDTAWVMKDRTYLIPPENGDSTFL